MKKIVLAADLGGTNLRMGVVDQVGTLLYRTRIDTPQFGTPADIADALVRLANECREAAGVEGRDCAFGIAVPALINSSEGRIISSPNLPRLDGFNLSSAIADRLKVPVVLENDAISAAIGERWLGASRGIDNSICVTLGTGVGGGIILGGIPLRGIDGTAGEIGHVCVEPFGVDCGCGSFGCLEQYSSGNAIVRMARELADEFPESVLVDKIQLTPHEVYIAGKSGDKLALEVFRRMGFYLGIALAGLVNILNPEVIVIGGGAAGGWELFINEVADGIKRRAFQQPAERVKIVRADLGDDAGILGVASLALSQMDGNSITK